MNTMRSMLVVLGLLAASVAVGCGDDTSGGGGTGGSNTGGGADGGNGTGGGTGGNASGFVFADDDYSAYTQIDRHGAVEAGTAGIAAAEGLNVVEIRDAYNASNPEEDAQLMWADEITQSVTDLHAALDDDIEGAGLTPATVDQALDQAGPVIIPDTIKYDPSLPTSYPNGRNLEDQVVDITFAAVLLDLTVHDLDILAGLPLNPPENDVPFKSEFPYLADPH